MRIISKVVVAYLAFVVSVDAAADDYLSYFKQAGVEVTKVTGQTGSPVGSGFEIKAAYGYRPETAIEGHFVGVFLIKEGAFVEAIDLLPSERGLDFFPHIEEANKSHVVVSFLSDYGELKKRKYVLDLTKDKKLIEIIELAPAGIPDDLL